MYHFIMTLISKVSLAIYTLGLPAMHVNVKMAVQIVI